MNATTIIKNQVTDYYVFLSPIGFMPPAEPDKNSDNLPSKEFSDSLWKNLTKLNKQKEEKLIELNIRKTKEKLDLHIRKKVPSPEKFFKKYLKDQKPIFYPTSFINMDYSKNPKKSDEKDNKLKNPYVSASSDRNLRSSNKTEKDNTYNISEQEIYLRLDNDKNSSDESDSNSNNHDIIESSKTLTEENKINPLKFVAENKNGEDKTDLNFQSRSLDNPPTNNNLLDSKEPNVFNPKFINQSLPKVTYSTIHAYNLQNQNENIQSESTSSLNQPSNWSEPNNLENILITSKEVINQNLTSAGNPENNNSSNSKEPEKRKNSEDDNNLPQSDSGNPDVLNNENQTGNLEEQA